MTDRPTDQPTDGQAGVIGKLEFQHNNHTNLNLYIYFSENETRQPAGQPASRGKDSFSKLEDISEIIKYGDEKFVSLLFILRLCFIYISKK